VFREGDLLLEICARLDRHDRFELAGAVCNWYVCFTYCWVMSIRPGDAFAFEVPVLARAMPMGSTPPWLKKSCLREITASRRIGGSPQVTSTVLDAVGDAMALDA
jgi:hypothetical protein